jgi:hypothetical protein
VITRNSAMIAAWLMVIEQRLQIGRDCGSF